MSATLTGRVLNVQRFSLHDGPGIRTTVFLKGCPARCIWCHNPESQAFAHELVRLESRCVDCGACVSVCPHGAPPPGSATCDLCGACVDACPTGARELTGRDVTVLALTEEVLRDRVFYEDSGGGVTFSGGEPLAQIEFLRALLGAARGHGIHTAVDTCGYAPRDHLLDIVPLTDLFLFDVKLMDDARHRELTGLPNGPILDNLRALAESHPCVWVRVPIVPGQTDGQADLEALADWVANVDTIRRVSLLPFHGLGTAKARRLGRRPSSESLSPPPASRMRAIASIFRKRGLTVSIGG